MRCNRNDMLIRIGRELSHENYGHELLQAIGRTYISKSE
jgi:hypothetical protein